MKGLITRAFSGAIYVAVIVSLILFGGNYGFPCLCALFAILGALELQRLESESPAQGYIVYYDIIAVFLISLYPVISQLVNAEIAMLLICISVCMRFIMQIYSHNDNPAVKLGNSLLTYIYVGVPLLLASSMYLEYGGGIVLVMFLMIWLNDTGAYMVGCSIGRHKLFPRVSPKKSWEGFLGGMLFSILAGVLSFKLIPECEFPIPLYGVIVLGILVSIAATWGDLIESLLKRAADVKDSGKIMPGHGGILDRIDSLLLVAPILWILMIIFKYI